MTWEELEEADPHDLLKMSDAFSRQFPPCHLDRSVSIGMAAYGNFQTTLFALRALLASATGEFELILIDDASPDETGVLFELVPHVHPHTRVFRFNRNIEYSGSLNTILSHACGDRIIFVSNDIFVTPAYLSQLLDVADRMPGAGIVRGCANFVDNGLLPHNVPDCGALDNFESLFAYARERSADYDGRVIDDPFLTGDAFLVTRRLLDCIGYLDPLFYGYFSDHDFWVRARQAGFSSLLALGAFAWHQHGSNMDYLTSAEREQKLRTRWARVDENWARFKLKYALPVNMPYDGMRRIPWDGLSALTLDPGGIMEPVDHSSFSLPEPMTPAWYRHRAAQMATRARRLMDAARLEAAAGMCRDALMISQDHTDALTMLGTVQVYQGRLKSAINTFRQVLKIDPQHVKARSNLLLAMNYDEGASQEALLKESLAWGVCHCPEPAVPPERRPLRSRIRIAYISPDFRQHSVGYFFMPLLEHHDRNRFEIFCISDVAWPDQTTANMSARADGWRDISRLSNNEAEACIREIAPDVLIDLAGHTGREIRLPLFCRRLAPLQASWLGYPNTTGIPAMDYRFTDDVADPPGEADSQYCERLVRLEGGFLCYSPPGQAPELAAPPVLTRGYITFGSFNMLPKIQDRAVSAWCRILNLVPGSRLLLKNHFLTDTGTARRLLARFTRHGIGKERIILRGSCPDTMSHLECYNQIDMALDTFPYNGTTTTCEALWMGVPVVTVRGERHAARVGASILTMTGLEEWIADSVDDYVHRCVELAGHPEYLDEMRQQLRQRLQSGLCDGRRFTRNLEAVILELLHDTTS